MRDRVAKPARMRAVVVSTVLVGFLIVPTVFAQPLQPATGRLPAQVGVAAAVHGKVELTSPGAVGRIAESGKPISLGDVVTTDARGRLQILLLDETVFTIGPSSSIVIDEFIYDPKTHDGKLTAKALKGTFRFVTGRIAHKEPKNMTVSLPAGTIGVRGTMVTGRITGEKSFVALLGPGPENRVGARVGRIEVGNEVRGDWRSVVIARPGYGTVIGSADAPPTAPEAIPAQVLETLNQELTPSSQASHATPRPDSTATTETPTKVSDGTAETPPPVKRLQEMVNQGRLSQEQMNGMLTDRGAWQTGDETTRGALIEKYGSHEDASDSPTTGAAMETLDGMTSFEGFEGRTAEQLQTTFSEFQAGMESYEQYQQSLADQQTYVEQYQQYLRESSNAAQASQTTPSNSTAASP